ncbi:LOW QUALITY PROTEIN: glycine N-acyltransferase-like protein 2 [Enhydra lutris kenyoni]|uniref:Glycine N-acyltransferase-like protein n=1 Tax=Enhydra lutris kenyoni TaxID=391180 RepID=A0A2Y9JRZ7_ENHLU|nr:LOW QUALITY PROTEIN: glycine N-acyltransferase-like protein 2 [Enhydra lutris kenyoni]
MFVLHEPQKLQILYESLEKSIPESLKAYGAIFNTKNKTPFNMEMLVDAWPDYQTVITLHWKEEMKDDLDRYINTYHIFTKAPDKLAEVLACSQVISWEQTFQIQGCQVNVGEAIRKISAAKSAQVDHLKTTLIMTEIPAEPKTSRDDQMALVESFSMPKVDEDSKKGRFQNIFLDASHVGLVNEQWNFGKNERSLKYIECCLQNFPGFGVLSPEGDPISWIMMEQSCEMRMGYTVPKYRDKGYMKKICFHFIKYFFQKKMPFYFHVSRDEENFQALRSVGLKAAPCGWHQWRCTPRKYY